MCGWSIRSVVIVVATLLGVSEPAGAGAPCWPLPVEGVVVDPFRQPGCVWCAGNRGIEYEVEAGAAIRAVAAGTVTFSGMVVGERYVVVELASGWKLTYGRVASTSLAAGDPVVRGTMLARSANRFLFGVRIDGDYVDPAPFLGVEVGRWRLVPTDGRPARPAPPPTLRCGAEQR